MCMFHPRLVELNERVNHSNVCDCKKDAEVWVYNGPGKGFPCAVRRCLVPCVLSF